MTTSLRAKSFDAFVAEQERDPEFKALLDGERERLRGDDPPAAGVREPRRPPAAARHARIWKGRTVTLYRKIEIGRSAVSGVPTYEYRPADVTDEMVERAVAAMNAERDARLERWMDGDFSGWTDDIDEAFRKTARLVLTAALQDSVRPQEDS